MSETTTTPPAAEVTPPAAEPQVPATPPPSPPEPAEDNNLLNTILGLIKPEDKKVTADPVKKEETPAAAKPAAPETPPKKIGVKKKEAAPAPPPAAVSDDKIDEAVRRAMVTHQAQTPPPARAPDPEPALPDDISADEKDELELYKFVESKDPAKKGLHAKALKFVADNKKFLEKRLEEEGDDYDPAKDPQYKKFLDANEPKLSQTEKRRFMIQRETDGLKQEAYEKARSELLPEIQATKKKLLEIEESPKIHSRLSSYSDELASVMPEEVVNYWKENNKDFAKMKEAFPIEHDAVVASVSGAIRVAQEFLKMRSGLTDFKDSSPEHDYMLKFVDNQAKVFDSRGGDARVRDGKMFAHPYHMKPGMERTHWTFDNEDILGMLKYQAGREAKARINAEYSRIDEANDARKRRSSAQKGAETPDPVSPSISSSPSPGASQPSNISENGVLASILGFGTK